LGLNAVWWPICDLGSSVEYIQLIGYYKTVSDSHFIYVGADRYRKLDITVFPLTGNKNVVLTSKEIRYLVSYSRSDSQSALESGMRYPQSQASRPHYQWR